MSDMTAGPRRQTADPEWRRGIGRRVEQRIADLGTSVAQVARVADVDESTLRRLIRGQTWPNAATRSRIEITLGWHFGEFVRAASAPSLQSQLAEFSTRDLLLEIARRNHETERRAGR